LPRDDRRLGKGLGALLGESLEVDESPATEREAEVARIRPNPFQPRDEFDEDSLRRLAESIAENGLLQPIVVRDVGAAFQIIAGERRFRAVQELGWDRVPIVTRSLTDEQMLVVALVENLQREDLNPLEEAQGYQRLIDEFGLTQEEVGRHVGKDRSTVSNALRLLGLPAAVRSLIASGRISAGHARAVLGLDGAAEQVAMAERAAKKGWSVRETERRVKAGRGQSQGTRGSGTAGARASDPAARRAELVLERALGTQVRVRVSPRGTGEVVISFHDGDDFVRLMERIVGSGAATELT
jgi:ParB family chromosome partitioning protein